MQIGQCRLKINTLGSDVPIARCSPAEVLLLKKGFEQAANGEAILDLKLLGNSNISPADELQRLKDKYNGLKIKNDQGKDQGVIEVLFPGAAPRMPMTFAEIGYGTLEKGTTQIPNYAPEAGANERVLTIDAQGFPTLAEVKQVDGGDGNGEIKLEVQEDSPSTADQAPTEAVAPPADSMVPSTPKIRKR